MRIRKIESKREQRKKRVAAYCRVSTESELQEESYETQQRYYEALIKGHDDWEFAGIYADRGISGTKAKTRPEFQRCIDDAVAGKIDLILVKSISRFSRNITDCQRIAEKLRTNGVDVRFEKENISTMDPSTDMIFSLMGLIAENESKSISDNERWSFQKRSAAGIYTIKNTLGYTMVDGKAVPNKDAWIIKMVFDEFLEGRSYKQIAEDVEETEKRKYGGKFTITGAGIHCILKNEAYVGDKILQKHAPNNFLTHKRDPSISAKRYYVRDGHTPIIDRETWNRTKALMDERKKISGSGAHYQTGRSHILFGKVFCAECGSPYMRLNVTSTNDRKWKVWCCRDRNKGKKGNGCKNRNIKEEDLLLAIKEETGIDLTNADQQTKFPYVIKVHSDHLEITPEG